MALGVGVSLRDKARGKDSALLWQVVDQLMVIQSSEMVSQWWDSHPSQLMVGL